MAESLGCSCTFDSVCKDCYEKYVNPNMTSPVTWDTYTRRSRLDCEDYD